MRGAILTLLVTTILIAGNHIQQYEAQAGKIQNTGENAINPSILTSADSTSTHQQQSCYDKAKNYLKKAFGPEYLAAWILVLAASIGLYATFRTLRTINRQTSAIEAQTKATQGSVGVLIAIERARIDGEIVPVRKLAVLLYSLKVTNQGKTPAHVSGYDIRYGAITEGLQWSEDSLTQHLPESKQMLVGAGKTETLRDDFNLNQMFTLESGAPVRGVLRVTIQYGDVIGDGQRQEHHTSFVYLYNTTLNHLVRDPDCNEYT